MLWINGILTIIIAISNFSVHRRKACAPFKSKKSLPRLEFALDLLVVVCLLPWDRLISMPCIFIYFFAINAASLPERNLMNSDTNMACADKVTVAGLLP